jgi:hypothetical protein
MMRLDGATSAGHPFAVVPAKAGTHNPWRL